MSSRAAKKRAKARGLKVAEAQLREYWRLRDAYLRTESVLERECASILRRLMGAGE